MNNKKLHINLKKVLLITGIPFFIGASGNKNDTSPCINGGYSFAVTAAFIPQREIYNVGDTIFLTSSFPKTLLENISNHKANIKPGPAGNLYNFQ